MFYDDAKALIEENKSLLEENANMRHHIALLTKAIAPFRTGMLAWGQIKAWIVNGAPTRDEGIASAKALTDAQVALDNAISKVRELN